MQTSKLSKFIKTAPWLLGFFPALALAFLLSAELVSDSSAETLTVTLDDSAYYLNIEADDINLEVNTTPEGKFNRVSDAVKVFTNSGTGYKLYLSMNSDTENSNRLYRDGDTTSENYLKPTSAQNNEPELNSWGFSLDGTSWKPVPIYSTEPIQLIKTSEAKAFPSDGAGDTTEIYYGVKADSSMPNGEYSGVIKYTALADATSSTTPYTRSVVTNATDGGPYATIAGGDAVTFTTGLFTNASDLGEITLTIGGKSCGQAITTDTSTGVLKITCSQTPAFDVGGLIGANITIKKFDKTYSSTVNYATISEITYMQDMNSLICNNTRTPDAKSGDAINAYVPQATLTDSRDNNTYIVRKYADGHCWMAQNLNLGDKAITLTPDDTDIVGRNFSLKDPDVQGTNTYSTDIGGAGAQIVVRDLGDIWFTNGTTVTHTKGNNDNTRYAGNHYSSYAANAGRRSDESICPKGWKLPYTYASASADRKDLYTNLFITTYGISASQATQILDAPFNYNFGISDYGIFDYTDGKTYAMAYYWDGFNYMSYFAFNASGYYGRKTTNFNGLAPVRCVAR